DLLRRADDPDAARQVAREHRDGELQQLQRRRRLRRRQQRQGRQRQWWRGLPQCRPRDLGWLHAERRQRLRHADRRRRQRQAEWWQRAGPADRRRRIGHVPVRRHLERKQLSGRPDGLHGRLGQGDLQREP
ncbi:Uncharacterized protein APZ42_005494, partial [Daphnia magna]